MTSETIPTATPFTDAAGPVNRQPAEVDGLVSAVRARLARGSGTLTPQLVAEALRAEGRPVGDATVLAVHDALRREVLGAGPLEALLELPDVTDVLVNGPGAVYVDRGDGLELTDVEFPDDAAVRRLGQRLAAAAGRRLDDAAPFVDARLRDGTRFHAVLAPLSRPGTVLSLRVPRRRVFTLAELVDAGTVTRDAARVLEAVVQHRLAVLVSGGTGAGKTTLLSSLLSLVAADQRLVLVEDSGELRPDHPHVVSLEARPANIEGAGEVTVRDLVRQALRMRPDRLVVGEVRGAEVVDLLAALNTGHTRAGSAPSTRTPPPMCPRGSKAWRLRPGWGGPRRTASSPRRSTRSCTSPAIGRGGAG